MEEGKSLQDRVRAAKRKIEAGEMVRVPLPGYQGMLVGVYTLRDWQTRVEINIAREEAQQPGEGRAEVLWNAGIDHLLASSKTVEAVDGDEMQDLNMPLGLGLASWLGLNESTSDGVLAQTDRDALTLIIDDGEDLIKHFGRVLDEQAVGGEKANESLVGESEAAT
jgi:hypothetical protein